MIRIDLAIQNNRAAPTIVQTHLLVLSGCTRREEDDEQGGVDVVLSVREVGSLIDQPLSHRLEIL